MFKDYLSFNRDEDGKSTKSAAGIGNITDGNANEVTNGDGKGRYVYDYPRPAVTADCVIFGFDGRELKVLLIERGVEPFVGMWALPGGFMRMNETIEECARRELAEETGVTRVYLEQFHVFSGTKRDPRGRVVTVAFMALVRPDDYHVVGGDDAVRAMWFGTEMLPPLAFDHQEIIEFARDYLREVLRIRPVAFKLLDEVFTVDELRQVYEAINGTSYDRRNFQRKLMQSDILVDADMSDCQSLDDCDMDCARLVSRSSRRAKKYSLKAEVGDLEKEKRPRRSLKDLFNF